MRLPAWRRQLPQRPSARVRSRAESSLFSLRFDVPSKCAALLHEGSIDVGMIPSIEYLRGHDVYCIAPDLGIVSTGRWRRWRCSRKCRSPRSVRSRRTRARERRTRCCASSAASASASSRSFSRCAPDLTRCSRGAMPRCSSATRRCFSTTRRAGLTKVDLGEEWTAMTGAAVRLGVLGGTARRAERRQHVTALQAARDAGIAASDAHCRRVLRAGTGRARPGVSEGEYPLHAGRARSEPGSALLL